MERGGTARIIKSDESKIFDESNNWDHSFTYLSYALESWGPDPESFDKTKVPINILRKVLQETDGEMGSVA